MNIVILEDTPAFFDSCVGTRIIHPTEFRKAMVESVESFDFTTGAVPGQGFILCPRAVPHISAGVGRRQPLPSSYVLRAHRGRVEAFLQRGFAGPKAPLTPHRLVANLAGGNRAALVWTADEIRAEAMASNEYDREWCVVAD